MAIDEGIVKATRPAPVVWFGKEQWDIKGDST
jgi:hypothetical protein